MLGVLVIGGGCGLGGGQWGDRGGRILYSSYFSTFADDRGEYEGLYRCCYPYWLLGLGLILLLVGWFWVFA